MNGKEPQKVGAELATHVIAGRLDAPGRRTFAKHADRELMAEVLAIGVTGQRWDSQVDA
ncbi:hypothetical protein [Mycobacterium sp. MMS18-G62]